MDNCGENINKRNPHGDTPLKRAISNNQTDGDIYTFVNQLLSKYSSDVIEVDAPNDMGVTALWFACRLGMAKTAELLIHHGADPHHVADDRSCLYVASGIPDKAKRKATVSMLRKYIKD